MVTARTPQEQLVLDFFRVLSSGDLEAIRATLHPDATWRPMVEGVPGAGVHGPRDKIVDEFLAPVRGLFAPGDPKTTVDRMVSTGDTVMCESRGMGRLRDGRPYNNRYAWHPRIHGQSLRRDPLWRRRVTPHRCRRGR